MQLAKPADLLGTEHHLRLAEQCIHEQTPAHPDPAMNPPHGELDSRLLERFPPGQHVLIDAVDQGAIQVEQDSRMPPVALAHGVASLSAGRRRRFVTYDSPSSHGGTVGTVT